MIYPEDLPQLIADAQKALPELHVHGFDVKHINDDFSDYLFEIYMCCAFMGQLEIAKSENQHHCSYSLKGVLERRIGTYIPNGVLIIAAQIMGIPVYRSLGKSNACFGITLRSLKVLHISKRKLPPVEKTKYPVESVREVFNSLC